MIMAGPGRTAVRPLVLAAVLLAVLGSAGCSRELEVSMSDPQTVTATGTAAEPAAETSTDDATAPPSDEATVQEASAAASPTTRTKKPAWGGGTRVGTYRTRGTVTGDDGTDRVIRSVTGTCELAHDVRTVTSTLEKGAVLVVHVTGPNVAEITLTVEGEPTRSVEYVGDATPVITLTPRRTEVRAALLVPPAGSDAPPVRVDASFDC
ncbi:hypothetical protein [Kineosporia sp. A_224]|uniref:hypothetical protein n=1 Tax=Kineosporia sp. A_224 TaxID=1962180 RepID=UPI000B4A7981|nr:hypothetical protein [Kineosporia sp. A_224]